MTKLQASYTCHFIYNWVSVKLQRTYIDHARSCYLLKLIICSYYVCVLDIKAPLEDHKWNERIHNSIIEFPEMDNRLYYLQRIKLKWELLWSTEIVLLVVQSNTKYF